MSWIMIVQLLIVLGALWVGSRYGSLALGAISGIGLAILVFCFGMKPGTPPTDVIYIIIAAAALKNVYDRRMTVTRGLKITKEAPLMRHFTVELERLG